MKIADMHCDSLSRLYFGEMEGLRAGAGQVNALLLKAGGYVLQNFAAFMERRGVPLFQLCMGMIDRLEEELALNADLLAPAYSYGGILENQRAGKISALLTVEDGAAIEGQLDRLSALYSRGVRMLGFTWNYRNELGAPNCNAAGDGETAGEGLTKLGFQALEEMERLGMIVDVSHLSDAGFWDICRQAKKPFVASHSNARALCDNPRNLTDEMLRALADKGGLVGLNFHAPFLSRAPRAGFADGAAHVKHMLNVAGSGAVALGSDFDGIGDAGEFQNAGHVPAFLEYLVKEGLGEDRVEALASGNLLAFYRENLVEKPK